MIKKSNNKWKVTNKTGSKTLGTHDSKKDAIKQLQAIEVSKSKKESTDSESQYTTVKSATVLGEKVLPGKEVTRHVMFLHVDPPFKNNEYILGFYFKPTITQYDEYGRTIGDHYIGFIAADEKGNQINKKPLTPKIVGTNILYVLYDTLGYQEITYINENKNEDLKLKNLERENLLKKMADKFKGKKSLEPSSFKGYFDKDKEKKKGNSTITTNTTDNPFDLEEQNLEEEGDGGDAGQGGGGSYGSTDSVTYDGDDATFWAGKQTGKRKKMKTNGLTSMGGNKYLGEIINSYEEQKLANFFEELGYKKLYEEYKQESLKESQKVKEYNFLLESLEEQWNDGKLSGAQDKEPTWDRNLDGMKKMLGNMISALKTIAKDPKKVEKYKINYLMFGGLNQARNALNNDDVAKAIEALASVLKSKPDETIVNMIYPIYANLQDIGGEVKVDTVKSVTEPKSNDGEGEEKTVPGGVKESD